MTSLETLIREVRDKRANQKSSFVRYATEIDTKILTEQYEQIKAQAPKRNARHKKYLFERKGVPSSRKESKRTEERG